MNIRRTLQVNKNTILTCEVEHRIDEVKFLFYINDDYICCKLLDNYESLIILNDKITTEINSFTDYTKLIEFIQYHFSDLQERMSLVKKLHKICEE